jgi:hypothetical protein
MIHRQNLNSISDEPEFAAQYFFEIPWPGFHAVRFETIRKDDIKNRLLYFEEKFKFFYLSPVGGGAGRGWIC